jgi:hypothetical protein
MANLLRTTLARPPPPPPPASSLDALPMYARRRQDQRLVVVIHFEAISMLSAFRPRWVPGPTSKFVAACPSPDGLRKMEHKGKTWLVLSRTKGDVLVVGVTSVRARESEPVPQLVPPRDPLA